jgi:hypothetical protein
MKKKKGGNGFIKEIRLRKSESDGENVETIYFGEERLRADIIEIDFNC